jgi:rhodanese-related sulfurtransferase
VQPSLCSSTNPAVKAISAQAFGALIDSGGAGVVLDVRTEIEHKACCLAAPHVHIPMDRFSASAFVAERGRESPVYVLCAAGGRATQAAEALVAAGHQNVSVVSGGLNACESGGVPVLRNDSVMSLERQVRIAAGALVLGGVVLGGMGAPIFYILSGAVGAGLIFAGVTNRCGLAMLLARAPWNRTDLPDAMPTCCGTGPSGHKAP